MSDIRLIHKNEKGFVLPLGLMFLAIIAILGTTAVIVTTTDLKIGSNYRASEQAFYAAEAGLEEARARLRGSSTADDYAGDPSATYDTWWSAYILTSGSWQTSDDPNYDANYKNYIPTSSSHINTAITANSLQTDILYFVKIRHKREYDAEQTGHTILLPHYYDGDGNTGTNPSSAPGSIIYYGYGNPATPTTAVQFTTSGTTEYKPVEIITAYGQSSNSLKTVEIEVRKNPGPLVNSALYAKGDVTGNGSALSVDGNDNCGAASAKPPVYTLAPSVTNTSGSPTFLGNPATPQQGTDSVDIAVYVNDLKASATETITEDSSGTTYGDASNFVTCYSDTSNPYNVNGLKLSNATGYGTLLVEGDLTLGGGFSWNGLILVTGTLVFNGGGLGINIKGAVLANQTVDINGGIDIKYDSCMVDSSLNNQSLDIVSWKESY
ncbi:MAG: pilus assembly PilX N-terminal domain-containing protein [Thermodesulfobacteriota bacterium]|nr:pilus assembly PilX N-terminal domain-containing protein [Thermodesulfobacteriota bacterium]